MKARFYNLPFTQTSRDRVLYDNALQRDEQFNSYECIELDVSNNRRLSSNAFEIKVHGIVSDIEKYNYVVYNNYYLFIDSVVEDTKSVVEVDCTLDVFTQYFLYDDINDDVEVYIERAHFDRFKKVDDKYVIDYDNPDMLTGEPFDVESILKIDEGLLETSENITWLELITNENMSGIVNNDSNHSQFINSNTLVNANTNAELQQLNLVSLYLPLTKLPYVLISSIHDGGSYVLIRPENIREFLQTTPEIIDIRVVNHTPFSYTSQVINNDFEDILKITCIDVNVKESGGGQYVLDATFGNAKTLNAPTHHIYGNYIISNYEPKIRQFLKYRFSSGNVYRDIAFDMLKNEEMKMSYLVSPSTMDTRHKLSINYPLDVSIDSVGDNTLPLNIDTFKLYAVDRRISLTENNPLQNIGGFTSGAFLGRRLGVKGMIGGALIGLGISTMIDTDRVRREDIENSPNTIISRGTNGQMSVIDGNNLIAQYEVYAPIESDVRHIHDVLFNYGYSLERVDNFKKYLKNRMVFNSIKLLSDTDVLSRPLISSHNDYIKTRLNQGMKFWHNMQDVNKKININIERNLVDVNI